MPKEKILVVDDDEGDRKYVSHVLQREGYFIEEAASGTRALKCITSSPPDLVIMKMLTSRFEGIVLVRRIRAVVVAPILAYTPITDQTRLEALEAGVNDFLTRPFHITELLARTRALLITGKAAREIAELKRTVEAMIGERTESLSRALSTQSALTAEAERARLELEVAINAMRDGLVITDADGRINRANNRALLLLGRSFRGLFGRPCEELLVDGAAVCPHYLLSEACLSAEAERVTRRTERRLQIRAHRIANAQGILIGFAHVLQDLGGVQPVEALTKARAAPVAASLAAQ